MHDDESRPSESAPETDDTVAAPSSGSEDDGRAVGSGSALAPGTADMVANGDVGIAVARTRKASRINPDDRRFVQAITAGVIIAGLVAFAISFVALMDIATWLGLPRWMSWAVPVFIDLAILVYAGSALIHKTRGERTWPSWLLLLVFTGLSVIANAAHAVANGHTDEAWQGTVGAVVAGMVPIAVFSATEQLSRVAVESPASRRAELDAAAEWTAAQVERERERREFAAERERAQREAELAREEHARRLAEMRAEGNARIAEISAPPRPTTSPPTLADPEPATPSGDRESVAAFVAERTQAGLETSGADLAREFGFSDKTGRRRLADLRANRPEIFRTEVTEVPEPGQTEADNGPDDPDANDSGSEVLTDAEAVSADTGP
jgi:hypothetical protein